MKFFLSLLLSLGLFTLGCEDDPKKGDGINSGARLAKLEGKLTFLGKNSDAKVSVMAGKEQVKGSFNPTTKKFEFNDLPPGPKTLVVQKGGKTFGLKFPKSNKEGQGKMASVIPDTQPLKEDKSIDLGNLKLAEGGTHFQAENNPLGQLDTDGDSISDYEDEDLDGDDILNWEDENPWGDEWADEDAWMSEYGWDDEGTEWLDEYWDMDGDGIADWEDADGADWVDWDEVPVEDFGFSEEYTLEMYCAEVPDDPACSMEGEWDVYAFCAEFPYDPSCSGDASFCGEYSDDPLCSDFTMEDYCAQNPYDWGCDASGEDVDCEADPYNPACGEIDPENFCADNPEIPECYCLMNPEDPECDGTME